MTEKCLATQNCGYTKFEGKLRTEIHIDYVLLLIEIRLST